MDQSASRTSRSCLQLAGAVGDLLLGDNYIGICRLLAATAVPSSWVYSFVYALAVLYFMFFRTEES